jgi:hypothetical protein
MAQFNRATQYARVRARKRILRARRHGAIRPPGWPACAGHDSCLFGEIATAFDAGRVLDFPASPYARNDDTSRRFRKSLPADDIVDWPTEISKPEVIRRTIAPEGSDRNGITAGTVAAI